jgi:putative nucleotidyltransferase with HDIG domain
MLRLLDAAVRGDWPRAFPDSPPPEALARPELGMTPGEMPHGERLAGARESWDALRALGAGDAGRAEEEGDAPPRGASTDGLPILAWTALLHDIGKPATFVRGEDRIRFHEHDALGRRMALEVLERLRRPRRVIDAVADIIGRHIHFATLRRMKTAKRRRWLREPDFPLHLELHRLDCLSSHRMLANWAFALTEWRGERARPPEPEPLATGRDVLALGLPPGPQVGAWLRELEDERLEGRVATRDEALAFLAKKREEST